MFSIKICGITRIVDARIATLAGADAIGLNFYEYSSRFVDLVTAEKIAADPQTRACKVGVFVNATAEVVAQTADRLRLDWIQLHGDEPPEFVSALAPRRVIKAFRVGADGLAAAGDHLAACRALGRLPDAVLLDAFQSGEYGGTGQTADWSVIGAGLPVLGGIPLVLAGGLTPFNVEDAVGLVHPAAVDTASGVESKPGIKDPLLVRAFVNTARKALAQLGPAH